MKKFWGGFTIKSIFRPFKLLIRLDACPHLLSMEDHQNQDECPFKCSTRMATLPYMLPSGHANTASQTTSQQQSNKVGPRNFEFQIFVNFRAFWIYDLWVKFAKPILGFVWFLYKVFFLKKLHFEFRMLEICFESYLGIKSLGSCKRKLLFWTLIKDVSMILVWGILKFFLPFFPLR